MITRKEIAVMYRCEYRKISDLMKQFGIGDGDKRGKGRRLMLTPLEFELFKAKVGEPIKR
jgi:hypothetical protein